MMLAWESLEVRSSNHFGNDVGVEVTGCESLRVSTGSKDVGVGVGGQPMLLWGSLLAWELWGVK